MDQQPEKDKDGKADKRLPVPSRIDPGWATIIASALALIGTLAALWNRQPQTAPLPPATATVEIAATAPPTATTAPPDPSPTDVPPDPTVTEPPPTAAPATPTNEPPTPLRKSAELTTTPTAAATIPPAIVTTILDVPPDERAATQETAKSLLDATKALPLIIRDPFDVNDYAWMEFEEKYDTGVECAAAIRDGGYHITSSSPTAARGPVWCMPTAPRETGDFYLTFDAELEQNQRADIMVYYRYVDDKNFYYLMLNPSTQLMTLGVEQHGEYMTILDRAFVPEIRQSGPNHLGIIVLGDAHVIYVNDTLYAHVTHETDLDKGRIRLGLQVYGAEQKEVLTIDNLELRGDL